MKKIFSEDFHPSPNQGQLVCKQTKYPFRRVYLVRVQSRTKLYEQYIAVLLFVCLMYLWWQSSKLWTSDVVLNIPLEIFRQWCFSFTTILACDNSFVKHSKKLKYWWVPGLEPTTFSSWTVIKKCLLGTKRFYHSRN